LDLLLSSLLELLPVHGPWLIFLLAVLETSFVTGLVVPSGVATSVGTVLALQGSLELAPLIGAALAGGAVGDLVGFWIGRVGGARVLDGNGRLSLFAARRHAAVSRLFGRHPFYSVTLARLVSFVRTLMPMAAGMSGLAFPRYLSYELLGLVGWAAIYVGIGALAGESWELVTQLVGAGGAAIFAVAGALLWWTLRRRARRRPALGPGSP